ncbi:hypothetical protein HB852_12715 [Listeria grandensis]|uniref:Uncharacterized protein n=2 Tax=Listeria grandensis TaxID=1494963 RepID=W7BR74_9LIST|nr:hypothetical protein [Listeria grandensis]EUJ22738.1 hypothetical protein PGRAN_11751 [Listeria grandensis FSL F6-0971]MBC1475476.1 hypothetical protein [Listeria grandensis]MBC1936244.1 hypothetical protein [Listeria grandensis]MBC6315198.1 hypothetical protein [Listeria grandensis]
MKKKIAFGAVCFLVALGISILLTQPEVKDAASKLKTNYIEATTVEDVTDPLTSLLDGQKDWFVEKLGGS